VMPRQSEVPAPVPPPPDWPANRPPPRVTIRPVPRRYRVLYRDKHMIEWKLLPDSFDHRGDAETYAKGIRGRQNLETLVHDTGEVRP